MELSGRLLEALVLLLQQNLTLFKGFPCWSTHNSSGCGAIIPHYNSTKMCESFDVSMISIGRLHFMMTGISIGLVLTKGVAMVTTGRGLLLSRLIAPRHTGRINVTRRSKRGPISFMVYLKSCNCFITEEKLSRLEEEEWCDGMIYSAFYTVRPFTDSEMLIMIERRRVKVWTRFKSPGVLSFLTTSVWVFMWWACAGYLLPTTHIFA